MYYVNIPEIDVADGRSVRIEVAAHGEYWDRRRRVDQWRDSYSAWSLAPFVVIFLVTDFDETIEQYQAVMLDATDQEPVTI